MAENAPPAEAFRNSTNTTIINSNLIVVGGNYTAHSPAPSRAESKADIARWLSSLDFEYVQDETYRRHAPGTGDWLIKSWEAQQWIRRDPESMWITGMPGAGKTYALSKMVNHLQSEVHVNGPKAVVFAYFRFNESGAYTTRDIFASLASQLLRSSAGDVVHDDFADAYAQHANHAASTTTLLRLLKSSFAKLKRAFVALDALDELPEDVRNEVLKGLATLGCHAFITSRPHLESSMSLLPKVKHVRWEDLADRNLDIRRFVMHKFDTEPRLKAVCDGKPEFKQEVCESLVQKSDGMFLVSALQILSLQRATTAKDIRNCVSTMPNGVNEMHMVIWTQVQKQHPREAVLAKRAIIWLLRGLNGRLPDTAPPRDMYFDYELDCMEMYENRLDPLCEALGISVEDDDWKADAVPAETVVVEACLGLITFGYQGHLARTRFRFSHYTTRDFFDQLGRTLHPTPYSFVLRSRIIHLQSLGFPGILLPPGLRNSGQAVAFCDLEEVFSRSALFADTIGTWIQLIAQCYKQEGIPPSLLDILGRWTHIPVEEYLFHVPQLFGLPSSALEFINPTHLAMFANITDLLPADLVSVSNITTYPSGYSTLHVAIASAAPEILRRLLASKAFDINATARWSPLAEITPLAYAAWTGNLPAISMLLGCPGIKVNPTGKKCSPLCEAASGAHYDAVKLLLNCSETDINQRDPLGGETALHRAAYRPEMVRLIFSTNAGHTAMPHQVADVNALDNSRESVLMCLLHRSGTYSGLDNVKQSLELLLAHPGINVNVIGGGEQVSALHLAASHDHAQSILPCLLSHPSIRVDVRDGKGRTVLHPACSDNVDPMKTWEVVNIILARQEAKAIIDARCYRGRTPLIEAAVWGNINAIQLLLCDGADVNCWDNRGRTALDHILDHFHPDYAPFAHNRLREGGSIPFP